ncbi:MULTISPECIES: prepilin peptidase [Clostridium]|nr:MULTISPECIES: prepilin peptidase [Clostridium]ADK15937.1 putative type IV leader peptidase [Clostridium ljungdahlii DSM 13528]AGY75112.1 prepilin peptidase [Clostridium autoethanogenum DSM 10061]ALU35283.1 Type IV leader peptidase [Clostridium autoethanogenum DSM 10061]OAA87185.1 Type 4 prepilin-like proteins leader peptide-processing enzyme [Clostridium ljungdahlii DSM 13528]OVY49638.1 Type 4 prepilin-like proteins leader peptide-processing enzyme [Clostridium autoethanogenum]
MYILIFAIGFIIGMLLNTVIESISYNIVKNDKKTGSIFIPIICSLCFEVSFLRLGFTIILAKAIVMILILIIISFIDLNYRIIPDFMVIITLIMGIMLPFFIRSSFIDTILGMIFGGGTMFLLSLVPNVMGGGDIKLMFAIGSFLGLKKTLWAIFLAFVLSSIVGIILILFKVKGTKDYIPFGPFLSLGSFISLLVFM